MNRTYFISSFVQSWLIHTLSNFVFKFHLRNIEKRPDLNAIKIIGCKKEALEATAKLLVPLIFENDSKKHENISSKDLKQRLADADPNKS